MERRPGHQLRPPGAASRCTSPEFQGGAFDPWGGPGYDKCAQLINDQFANVFYKQNIAVGATAQSFYMTYGGTNWGWLGMPQNYTSYDYGAAIRETRQLDPKYDEDKLIGYFTQSVAPLTKTDAIRTDAAGRRRGRRHRADEPRHQARSSTCCGTATPRRRRSTRRTSRSTSTPSRSDTSYTYDDPDAALQYTGTWSHVANQSYTGGDYKHTESFSNMAGDCVTVPFTGTAVRWIGSKTNNHGIADVYLDGAKVGHGRRLAAAQNQAVFFADDGLADGPHTLKIVVDRHRTAPAPPTTSSSIDAIDVPAGAAPRDRPTRSCRSSPAPRSRSTAATRNIIVATTTWATSSCSTPPRRS